MEELFFSLLNEPSGEAYLAAREALISSEHYNPLSMELDQIDALLDAQKLEEGFKLIGSAMPNLLLSPRAHLKLAIIYMEID